MSAETSMSMIEPVNNTVVISSDCSFGLKKDVQEQVPMKKCKKCGRTLPTTEFNKSKANKDGLQYHHICEDIVPSLSDKSRAEANPIEYQKAENMCGIFLYMDLKPAMNSLAGAVVPMTMNAAE